MPAVSPVTNEYSSMKIRCHMSCSEFATFRTPHLGLTYITPTHSQSRLQSSPLARTHAQTIAIAAAPHPNHAAPGDGLHPPPLRRARIPLRRARSHRRTRLPHRPGFRRRSIRERACTNFPASAPLCKSISPAPAAGSEALPAGAAPRASCSSATPTPSFPSAPSTPCPGASAARVSTAPEPST